jgi:hypothetical protein
MLAGKTADISVEARPVADVLAALCAGPVPAELHGEASALAEFRALGLGQAGRPAPAMLPEALPAGSRPRPGRRPARHRVRPARQHPPRRATLRSAVLSAVAAAAVIVGAVLVTGNFAGPFRVIAHMASPSAGARSSASSAGHSAAPRVETSSAGLEPTAASPVTYSAGPAQPTPSEICQAYYTALKDPGPSPWATEQTLWGQLTKLAHSDNAFKVYRYCLPYVKGFFPAADAPAHSAQGNQDSGNRNGSGSGTASASPASTSPASNGQGNPGGSGSNP